MEPFQTGTTLEERVEIISLKWKKTLVNKNIKGNFRTPVRGEKAKGDITFAKEHKPEIHP